MHQLIDIPIIPVKGIIKYLKRCFKDSLISKQFSCGATKTAYVCYFGLAPYFKANLIKYLDNVEHYTVTFDETLNKATQLEADGYALLDSGIMIKVLPAINISVHCVCKS
ncbi:hypothetical protein AVEN_61195-1 [Araneus ventricosus]|uniref:Uncharacterized protein n=1 Tax=Araneus ventricosus TaxID=182803 RepID=A0A4Y2V333_ARAVE|nr:hypothetical protein AVEN_61195-1 [Araneus ventricosus]